jgi:CBS domain-containing protein
MAEKRAYDIMEKDVVAVSSTTSIISAVTLLENSNVDLLPVVDDGKLVGIINEDSLRSFAIRHSREELDAPIKPLVKEPIFVEASENINDVIVKVVRYNVTRIPVVDSISGMRCVGIISASDLLKSAGGRLGKADAK